MRNKVFRPGIILLLGLIFSLSAFLPAANAPFFNDDYVYIIGNQNFEKPITEIWKYFFIMVNNYEYLPIRDIVYRIQYEIFGENPFGYRLINYILYVICCVLVYINSKLIFRFIEGKFSIKTKSIELMSVFIAIFYAIHPAHVESVVWISSLKDLLSGSFLFLALYFFLIGLLGGSKKNIRLSWLYFSLALLSKSTVLPFIAIVFVLSSINYGFKKESIKQIFKVTLPFVFIGIIFLIVYLLIASESKILAAPFLFGTWQSLMQNLHVPFLILGYLVRIELLPINLRIIYDISGNLYSFLISLVLGVASVIATIVAIKKFNKTPVISFGIVWLTVFLTPFLQIVPFHSWSLVSERYVFLSTFGFVLILIYFLFSLRMKYVLITIIFSFYFYNTISYSLKWRSEAELIKNNAQLNPNHYISQVMYIENFLMVKNRYPEAYNRIDNLNISKMEKERLKRYVKVFELYETGRIDEIAEHIEWLEGMVNLYSWSSYLNILGTYYQNKQDFIKAIEYYYNAWIYTYLNQDKQAYMDKIEKLRHPYTHQIEELKSIIDRNPNSINAIGSLANLQLELYLLDEAEENYYKVLKISPNNPIAFYNLGLLYSKKREERKSVDFMEKAISLGFRSPIVYNNLGIAYSKIAKKKEAEKMFLEAIKQDETYWYAYVNLGKLYAISENVDKAIYYFEKAKQITLGQGVSAEFIDSYLNVLKSAEKKRE